MTDPGLYEMTFIGGASDGEMSHCTVHGLKDRYIYGPPPQGTEDIRSHRSVYRLSSVIRQVLRYDYVGEFDWNEFLNLQEISRVS